MCRICDGFRMLAVLKRYDSFLDTSHRFFVGVIETG